MYDYESILIVVLKNGTEDCIPSDDQSNINIYIIESFAFYVFKFISNGFENDIYDFDRRKEPRFGKFC